MEGVVEQINSDPITPIGWSGSGGIKSYLLSFSSATLRDSGTIVNEFNTIAGSVPFLGFYSGGLPLQIEGCIVSTGTLTSIGGGKLQVGISNVRIKGSNVPVLRSILDSDSSVLDAGALGGFIGRSTFPGM
ncbi:hypothetical protein TrRE_jg6315 [Triparma retinervis]|uniref:Uncharacterized protein n=1 Tax=Triparma retinervis TaxID=2557542 RepID=A0A9W6ZIP5_9STRA|nr:hypothetical protein TrRE_jg6315 [Triparma retinervis]